LLEQAKKYPELATELDGFKGISLKMQIRQHHSDINTYETLIASFNFK